MTDFDKPHLKKMISLRKASLTYDPVYGREQYEADLRALRSNDPMPPEGPETKWSVALVFFAVLFVALLGGAALIEWVGL